jgi:hypothetical protein
VLRGLGGGGKTRARVQGEDGDKSRAENYGVSFASVDVRDSGVGRSQAATRATAEWASSHFCHSFRWDHVDAQDGPL